MTAAVELVTRFCEEWHRLSPEEIKGFFGYEGVYRHVSIERSLRGHLEIAGAIEIYRARFEQIESEVLRISAAGEEVLCERREIFWLPSGRIVGFEAMSSVEVRDGKIQSWTDYFDVAGLKRQVDVTEG